MHAMVRFMSVIDLVIEPRTKDLGGFTVGRILPYAKRRMVGPFIFLDHMGPADFAAGQGIDVRPHPHIGLATVTYLFDGEILHRDTLGSNQLIHPGDVNWMTAGRGIAHSERTDPAEKARAHRMHGLQSWLALPKEHEETAPEFFHHPKETLPCITRNGATIHLVAGRAFGAQSPVKIYSPLFYAAVTLEAGATLELPNEYRERALYVLDGALRIGSTDIAPHTMPVFGAGERIVIEATAPSRLMVLGGEPFGEQRYMDWNFVSSDPERLLQARDDWQNQRFGTIPGDAVEFIPYPPAA